MLSNINSYQELDPKDVRLIGRRVLATAFWVPSAPTCLTSSTRPEAGTRRTSDFCFGPAGPPSRSGRACGARLSRQPIDGFVPSFPTCVQPAT